MTTITKLAGMVLYLIGIGVVSRTLNREEFGIYAFLSSLTFIAGFLSFGLGGELQNRLVKLQYLGEDAGGSLQQKEIFFSIFYAMLAIYLIIGFLLSFGVYHLNTALFIKTSDPTLLPTAKWLIALAILAQFVMQPFMIATSAMYAFSHITVHSVLQLIVLIVHLAALVIAVYFGGGFIIFSLINLFYPLIAAMTVLFTFLFMQKWHFMPIRLQRIIEMTRGMIKESATFWLLNISALVLFQTSIFMVSVVSDIATTGDFSFYQRLFYAMVMLHLAAVIPLWPNFSHENEKGNFVGMPSILRHAIFGTLLYFGVGIIVMFLFGQILVRFWADREIPIDRLTMTSLSLWALSFGWINVFSVFLNGVGKIKIQTTMVAVAATLVFPFSYYLGRKWGVAGIPLAGAILLVPIVIVLPTQVMSYLEKVQTPKIVR